MTWICYVGIEASAKTQLVLLGAEVVVLGISPWSRSARCTHPPGRLDHPSWSWINPFDIDSRDRPRRRVILAVFIYWGWDTTVTVNEETENPPRRRARRRWARTYPVPI